MARKKSASKRAKEESERKGEPLVEAVKTEPVKKVKPVQEPSESESSSDEEDEFGELITEDVEAGILKVLEAIKNDPSKLLDPTMKFFKDPESTVQEDKKDKPIYLKDYHRMNLLSGGYKDDDDAPVDYDVDHFNTVDGEKPFAVAQREERNQLLDDIKNAFDEEDDEDDFMTKKEPLRNKEHENEERQISRLPDPKNEKEFLSAFLDHQAWIPKKNDKVINLDRINQDDEEQFDDAVENFEHAYNFRYEDTNAAEIVSYARSQATLRRSNTNTRKNKRERQHEEKAKLNKEKDELVKKKKTSKMNKVVDRLTKIKEAVGDNVSDVTIQKVFGESLLNDDFDDADWDSKMAEIFNEQYYGAEIEKPLWDENDELMADFHQGKDAEDGEDFAEDGENANEDLGEDFDAEEPPKKKSKKDKIKEKSSSKKDKELLKAKAQEIIEANKHIIIDEVEEERGRAKEDIKFKYRDVSPESFGLTTRDIILADDKQLNNFIGIKKFAPYREKELRMKDKRKYTKKKHLNEWRKEVFHDKNGPKIPEGAGENDIWIPADEEESQEKFHSKSKKEKKRINKTK